MTKFIIILLFGLLLVSCSGTKSEKDNYPKNQAISTAQGIPKDSLAFYFPTAIQIDTNITNIVIDTFKQSWFSSALYFAKEPILYNSYQGHDIYRFLWLRSFLSPIVISLHKDGKQIWLTTKKLNKQPDFMDIICEEIEATDADGSKKLLLGKSSKEDSKAFLIFNQRKELTEKEWKEFEKTLDDCSFWTTKPYIKDGGMDGSEWIIEGHLKSKYWFVIRWSPNDNLRKAGEYLIKKSELNEEIY